MASSNNYGYRATVGKQSSGIGVASESQRALLGRLKFEGEMTEKHVSRRIPGEIADEGDVKKTSQTKAG